MRVKVSRSADPEDSQFPLQLPDVSLHLVIDGLTYKRMPVVFGHTHLVRGGSLDVAAYNEARRVLHTHFVRSGYVQNARR